MRRGITTLPASDAAVILRILRGVVALPLCDARPAQLVLSWRHDNVNPNIAELTRLVASGPAELEHDEPAGASRDGNAKRVARRREVATGSRASGASA
jgi:hypothetical protein